MKFLALEIEIEGVDWSNSEAILFNKNIPMQIIRYF